MSQLPGQVRVFADAHAAAQAAVDGLLARLKAQDVEKNGLCNVALSGGSTPNAMYDLLAKLPADRYLAMRGLAGKARFFWSDERTVPPEHADSNYGQAWTRWLRALELPAAQVVRLRGDRKPAAAAAEYENAIRRVVTVGEADRPAFDLIFLGMGPDAHTASLFPGTAAVQELARLVVANAVPQHNTTRLTFTFPLINAAKQVWVLCTGANKADALGKVAQTSAGGDWALPISKVRPAADGQALTWWLDRAAGSRIEDSRWKKEA